EFKGIGEPVGEPAPVECAEGETSHKRRQDDHMGIGGAPHEEGEILRPGYFVDEAGYTRDCEQEDNECFKAGRRHHAGNQISMRFLAITSFWISVVLSPIVTSLTSR